MPYESGFLKKCQSLANAHLKGKIDIEGFAQQVQEFYTSREKWAEGVTEVCTGKEYIEVSAKGSELGDQGLRDWEEGFRCWFDYTANEERELIEEGLLLMKQGNDLLNAAREAFLDSSEEGSVRFTL